MQYGASQVPSQSRSKHQTSPILTSSSLEAGGSYVSRDKREAGLRLHPGGWAAWNEVQYCPRAVPVIVVVE